MRDNQNYYIINKTRQSQLARSFLLLIDISLDATCYLEHYDNAKSFLDDYTCPYSGQLFQDEHIKERTYWIAAFYSLKIKKSKLS